MLTIHCIVLRKYHQDAGTMFEDIVLLLIDSGNLKGSTQNWAVPSAQTIALYHAGEVLEI